MKIIIIGMDNTGKTTLASRLSQDLGYNYIRSVGPSNKEKQEEFMNEFLNNDNPLVCDRFPLFDEMVYGKILRGKSNFTFKDNCFKKLIESEVYIIYCRPSNKTIFNFGDREQMEGVIDNSKKLLKQWDKVYRKIKRKNLTIIKYDYEKDDISKLQ